MFDYCFSIEKLLARNSVEKSKNQSNKVKKVAKDISFFGTKYTKGNLANKIIDQYKNSKNLFIITFIPNRFFCLGGYYIEEINPGKIQSIFYEKSKKRINEYIDIKPETDEYIQDINLEFKTIKKEIDNLF